MELSALDRLEIIELYSRFSHMFDAGHAAEVGQLFSADGAFVRANGSRVSGPSEIAKYVSDTAASGISTRHIAAVPIVQPTANGASGRCYVVTFMRDPDGEVRTAIGDYHDQLVISDGRWRIRLRRFNLWQTMGPKLETA